MTDGVIGLNGLAFDDVIERRETDSLKWDGMEGRFGPVPGDALPMWVADMDFLSPQEVVKAIQRRALHGVYGYVQAPSGVFRAVSDWLLATHGWETDSSWIVPCTGVMPAIGAAIRAFSDPGDGVVIQPPVYPPFFRIVRDNGREVVENPLINEEGYYRMNLEGLENLLKDRKNRILLLCSPHNPVGRVWTREELERVCRLCQETETLLVSDEIHADLVFEPSVHVPAATVAPDLADRVITCISPSKTFNIPGLQTAYTIINDEALRESFQASLRAAGIGAHNIFGLVAAETAYRHGDHWLKSALRYMRENIGRAIAFFQREMPWVKVHAPEGTYLLWLDMSASGLAPEAVTERLICKGRVVLDPGYWFGTQGSGWQRLNIACPRSLLEEGLRRMKDSF